MWKTKDCKLKTWIIHEPYINLTRTSFKIFFPSFYIRSFEIHNQDVCLIANWDFERSLLIFHELMALKFSLTLTVLKNNRILSSENLYIFILLTSTLRPRKVLLNCVLYWIILVSKKTIFNTTWAQNASQPPINNLVLHR